MASVAPANLYSAQQVSRESVHSHWFERRRVAHPSNYISACVEVLESGINAVLARIQCIADALFSALIWVCPCIGNTIYPINPINGKRHFVFLPRSVEKNLGNLLYSLITFRMAETNRTFKGKISINQKVQEVFKKIKDANQQLLWAQPSPSVEGYDYRVKVVNSTTINAFACAGGGMVVFTQIIKEIRDAVNNDTLEEKNVEIHFEDGSTATLDVSGVSVDDVIAALLGHEMTHVAARHTLQQLGLVLILTFIVSLVRGVLVGTILAEDSLVNELLINLENWIFEYLLHCNSRVSEYEADVTGIEFMKNAGFNPLGAIYLQEILTRMHRNDLLDYLHRKFEWFFTHPYGERRKRAAFAALSVLDRDKLKAHARLTLAQTNLDTRRASSAVCMADRIKRDLELENRIEPEV